MAHLANTRLHNIIVDGPPGGIEVEISRVYFHVTRKCLGLGAHGKTFVVEKIVQRYRSKMCTIGGTPGLASEIMALSQLCKINVVGEITKKGT